MFWKKKKRIFLLRYENTSLKNSIRMYKAEKKKSDLGLRFIEEQLNNQSTYLLQIYCINDNMYGIFITERSSIYNKTFEIITYEILLHAKICSSFVEIYELSDKSKKIMELISIDIHSEFEYRKGHASKHLDIYKKICQKHKIQKIYGDLFINTPIGIDNLKAFYHKNGFSTGKFKFVHIISDK